MIASKTYFDTGKEKLVFDAIFSTNYTNRLNITEHPVQVGANISDHAFEEATVLTFEIGMSDVMESYVEGQFGGNDSRSVDAYLKIRELQAQKLPLTVSTKFGIYNNMMVETISADDNSATTHALKATVVLKEIFVSEVTTVKISERPQKSSSTNEGDQKAIEADQSLLHKLFN